MADPYIPSYAVPVAGFQSRKAAQLCAFFALKSPKCMIEKLKLIKLIYMAERAFVAENHMPMLYDELYSLPHGPICSSTLNGINGVIDVDMWQDFIARHGNIITPVRSFGADDFDELSEAEMEVAEAIWAQFGHMSASRIRNYSHDHCPEYTETLSLRIPIQYRDILEAMGDTDADVVEREIRDIRRAEGMLVA